MECEANYPPLPKAWVKNAWCFTLFIRRNIMTAFFGIWTTLPFCCHNTHIL
jgi:hypothetical protein